MFTRLNLSSRNPWLGDRLRGLSRLAGVFGAIFLLGALGSAVVEDADTYAVAMGWGRGDAGALPLMYRWVFYALKIFRFVGSRLLHIAGERLAAFTHYTYTLLAFVHNAQRYFVLLTIAFGAIYITVASYLQSLHDLPTWRQAFRYLNALVFGIGYPRLEVDDGQALVERDEYNLLMQVGGPGYLIVQPGNLVVLEDFRAAPRVCAEGVSFITRFERIRDVINLDDQQNFIGEIDFTTKDGVRMRVRDVHYAFRLRTGRNSIEVERQNLHSPYPFSYTAVLDRVYARSVGTAGITLWKNMVNIAVDGTITDYMRARNFDTVASPKFDEDITRVEIARQLNAFGTRNRLRGVGAELLWVDMGHFEVVDKRIEEQRVRTWGSKWSGWAQYNLAFGEAKRLSYQEIGRAEAQAEMLLSIMNAFEETGVLEGLSEAERQRRVREIILARTTQFLESMASYKQVTRAPRRRLPPPR